MRRQKITGSYLDRQSVNTPTETLSTMTISIRFTKCSRLSRVAFITLMLSIGRLNIAHAEHAVSPSESAAASALTCFESWLDGATNIIATVQCMGRTWQMANRTQTTILTASLVKSIVRDIIMHLLARMWKFDNPNATPVALRYVDNIAKPPFMMNTRRDWRECSSRIGSIYFYGMLHRELCLLATVEIRIPWPKAGTEWRFHGHLLPSLYTGSFQAQGIRNLRENVDSPG
jgi:hypothetical protein